jgi:tetratricopeptide (TPR) repeat protein
LKRDARGLELSTDSGEAAALLDRAVEHYLKYHADTMSLVNGALAADPDCVMGHCIRGTLLLAAGNPAHRPVIDASLAAAQAGAAAATAREQRHVAAFAACRRGAFGQAFAIWRALLDADPTDLFALRVSNVTYFRYGQTRAILEQADRIAPAWSPELPGYECFQSVWAFAHEEVGDTKAAERAIDSAYPRDPENFFAHHVKAHILGAEGRPREGSDWLAAQTGYWPIGSNLVHHLWWHQALMLLDLGDRDAVLASYDNNIRNLNSAMTRAAPAQYNDLQNAAALLWRLEVLGVDVGGRWAELGEKAEARVGEPAQPLLPPDLMMSLAATGRDEAAARFLASLRAQAAESGAWDAAAIGDVVVPVCEAVLAHRRGQHARVVASMAPCLDQLRLLGGSAAQRDVFRQLLIDSAMKSGAREIAAAMIAEETATHPTPPVQRAGYAAPARWLM